MSFFHDLASAAASAAHASATADTVLAELQKLNASLVAGFIQDGLAGQKALDGQQQVITLLTSLNGQAVLANAGLAALAHDLKRLADAVAGPDVVGILVTPSPPVVKGKPVMTQKMNLALVRGGSLKAKPARAGANAPVVTTFNLVPGPGNTYTVVGVDADGDQMDVSQQATLAAVSDTPAAITAAVTTGMTFQVTKAAGAAVGATAKITLTATWNDSSRGPFSDTIQGTIQPGDVIGIAVV